MAIPPHCEPWPGKTNTVLPVTSATPCTTVAARSPSANRPSAVANSSYCSPTATTRWSNADRVLSSEKATSVAFCSACAANSRACRRSAPADFADSTHGTGAAAGSAAGGSSCTGACSRITCAFVPLTPNDETPARRG